MTIHRRVTRSVSNDLQARAAGQTQAQTSGVQSSVQLPDALPREAAGFCRNTSEEIFIRSIVDGSIGMAAPPSMEGIGFTNLAPTMRLDSEELFHNWICNAETHPGSGQSNVPYRSRHTSRRMSNELASLLQNGNQTFNRVDSFEQLLQTGFLSSDDMGGDGVQQPRSRILGTEKGDQAVDLSPLRTLSWFQQSQPMTRSRSSELRRRYAAMQGLPPPPTAETLQRQATQGTQELKQEVASLGAFARNLANGRVNQPPFFPQILQSSIPPFNMPPRGAGDSVSTVVSMLKGTLERKKLGNNQQWQQQQIINGVHPHQHRVQEDLLNRLAVPQFQTTNKADCLHQFPTTMHNEGHEQLHTIAQMHYESQMQAACSIGDGQVQPGQLSRAPSPSNSSGGAPVLSTGEDQCNSAQTNPNHENIFKRAAQTSADVDQYTKRQNSIGNHPSPSSIGGGTSETQPEHIQKTELSKKLSSLVRMGSVNSTGGSAFTMDKEDPTKKRRVERQRKMAEAKGRNCIPTMPSDLQAALKRCDNLEKEVRSLKLNLSFMNRKDSEQTKQIEELQKENEDLQAEKARLLNELERFASKSAPD
eukprot:c27339_g1_i1 orf=642-2408(+)